MCVCLYRYDDRDEAGKSAALHGLCHDATPFTFSEDNPAVDYFGKLLVKGIQWNTLRTEGSVLISKVS